MKYPPAGHKVIYLPYRPRRQLSFRRMSTGLYIARCSCERWELWAPMNRISAEWYWRDHLEMVIEGLRPGCGPRK